MKMKPRFVLNFIRWKIDLLLCAAYGFIVYGNLIFACMWIFLAGKIHHVLVIDLNHNDNNFKYQIMLVYFVAIMGNHVIIMEML